MRLTPQGQILLDYAQRAFELLAEGESQVEADRGALVGTVRVAAPSDLTRTVLLPWFDEFLRLHPGRAAGALGRRPAARRRALVDFLALKFASIQARETGPKIAA